MGALRHAATALVAGLLSQAATAACFVVYGPGPEQEVVYRSVHAPVDMSLPLHQTLPLVAPGGSLTFTRDHYGCDMEVNKLPLQPAQAAVAPRAEKAVVAQPG